MAARKTVTVSAEPEQDVSNFHFSEWASLADASRRPR